MLNYLKTNGINSEIELKTESLSTEYLAALGITMSFSSFSYEIKAFTTPTDNGYHILVNNRIPFDHQLDAFMHELIHIVKNDWQKEIPIREIEAENYF